MFGRERITALGGSLALLFLCFFFFYPSSFGVCVFKGCCSTSGGVSFFPLPLSFGSTAGSALSKRPPPPYMPRERGHRNLHTGLVVDVIVRIHEGMDEARPPQLLPLLLPLALSQ